jgi:hypothetical protein
MLSPIQQLNVAVYFISPRIPTFASLPGKQFDPGDIPAELHYPVSKLGWFD